jgi:hypothetical protein
MYIITDNDFVTVYHSPGKTNTTLISFSGINFEALKVGVGASSSLMQPEFVHTSPHIGDRFWIIDKKRSWGNLVDWAWLASLLKDYLINKQVVCVGTCTGAHNAIKFSYFAEASRVFAFTPHWTIDTEVIPEEYFDPVSRSVRQQAMEVLKHSTLAGLFNTKTEYIFMWSPDRIDVPHMLGFPKLPNIKTILCTELDHYIPAHLVKRKLLYDTIEQAIIAKDPQKEISLILERGGVKHEIS